MSNPKNVRLMWQNWKGSITRRRQHILIRNAIFWAPEMQILTVTAAFRLSSDVMELFDH